LAASADLFDFDCAGADADSNGCGGSVSGAGYGVGAVDEVIHPAFGSVSPITTDPALTSIMDLIIIFACPVHMGFALSPILQCQSGHIVCDSCCTKLSSCPTCRGILGTSCKWLIQLDQVMPPLLQYHKTLLLREAMSLLLISVDWAMMQSCSGHFFILLPEQQKRVYPDQVFFALVLLIGIKEQVDQFMYRPHLTAPARLLTQETKPWSIRGGAEVVIVVYDCLIFDSKTGRHYCDHLSRTQ
ncbi:E3 ubiquitin-protein ligase sina, partial [Taenia solium]